MGEGGRNVLVSQALAGPQPGAARAGQRAASLARAQCEGSLRCAARGACQTRLAASRLLLELGESSSSPAEGSALTG